MKKGLFIFWAMTFCCLGATTMFGQVKLSGEIFGSVVTENGETIPGANVTLSGEKLFQKSLTTVSNEKGQFRFHNLNPGSYDVEFEAPGFNKMKITGLLVSVGQTTPVYATMTQSTLQNEVVVVTSKTPLIETRTVQLSTNYSNDVVKNIPTQRNMLDLMESTPGVNDRGAYGAGGNADSDYYQGSSTSAYLLNGVDVSDLDSGATWVNPSYDTIEEIQVVGVGASAEYGNFSGAVLNVITKAGSNAYHGGLSTYYSDSRLAGNNSGGVIDLNPDDVKYNPEIAGNFGGPIIKEKMFFFLAGGYTGLRSKKYGDAAYATLRQPHFQGRLDWVPNAKNQLSFMVNSDPLNHDNLGLKPGSGEEVGYSRLFRSTAWHASWQYLMTANTIFNLKYAGFNGRDATDPNSPDVPSINDRSGNRVYGSSGYIINNLRSRNQVNATLTHYADDFLHASHEFKLGVEYEISSVKNNNDGTGGTGLTNIQVVSFSGLTIAYGWLGYNIHTEGKVNRIGAFAEDSVQVGKKLNVNLGLRYDGTRLTAKNVSGTITQFKNLAPRLGLSYDLTGDAKNVLRVSLGRYFDKTVTGGFTYALPGLGDVSAWAAFLPGPFVPTAENIANLSSYILSWNWMIFSGAGKTLTPVDKNIHTPYTDVLNLGYERLLFKDWALSLDYIYKRDRDLIVIDTKTQHTYKEVQFTDPYLGTSITLWDQVDRLPDQWYYTNSTWAKRNHHLAIVSLKKRLSNNWSFMSSLVYQNSQGNTDNTDGPVVYNWGQDTDPIYTQNPLQWGYLTYNRTWQFKLLGSYLLPMGFSVSGNFRILSGLNWEPNETFVLTGLYRDSSIRFPIEKRGNRRFPTTYFLDGRISKIFRVGQASNLELIADVFNIINRANGRQYYEMLGTVYPLSKEDAFSKPVHLFPPITLRLGFRLTF